MVFFEQLSIDARVVVKALNVPGCDKTDQVLVADIVFGKED